MSVLRKYLIYFIMIITATSCASKHDVSEKIIFLNYNISKNTQGDIQVILLNSTFANGKLKTNAKASKEKIGDLECVFLDKKLKPLYRTSIKNPLVKIVEFQNDENVLEHGIIELDSSQFTLRLQWYPDTKFVSINEIKSLENKTLNMTNIK
jgi:hypothetical protein